MKLDNDLKNRIKTGEFNTANKVVHHNTGAMTEDIYNVSLVMAELRRAEAKHSWDGISIERKALILSEEAGEVSRAVMRYLEEGADPSEIREELVQTAAMCLRFLKNLPAVPFVPYDFKNAAVPIKDSYKHTGSLSPSELKLSYQDEFNQLVLKKNLRFTGQLDPSTTMITFKIWPNSREFSDDLELLLEDDTWIGAYKSAIRGINEMWP